MVIFTSPDWLMDWLMEFKYNPLKTKTAENTWLELCGFGFPLYQETLWETSLFLQKNKWTFSFLIEVLTFLIAKDTERQENRAINDIIYNKIICNKDPGLKWTWNVTVT